jgi:hypothetical protein
VAPELLELIGGWQEWELQLLEDIGVNSVEIIDLGPFIVYGFCFWWASDRDFCVQDPFELVGDVTTVVLEAEADAGKLAHVAVCFTEQIVMLGNLQNHQSEKEFTVFS